MKQAVLFLCAAVLLVIAVASPVEISETSRRFTPRAEICQFVGPAAGCEAKCPEGFKEKGGGSGAGTCRTGQTIACCLSTEEEGGEGAEGKEVRG